MTTTRNSTQSSRMPPRQANAAAIVAKTSQVAAMAASVIVAVWWFAAPSEGDQKQSCRRLLSVMREVQGTLRAFQVKEGRPRLSDGEVSDRLIGLMVKERIVDVGTRGVRDPWAHQFRYQVKGEAIEVLSVGRDGRPSSDDIVLSAGTEGCLRALGGNP